MFQRVEDSARETAKNLKTEDDETSLSIPLAACEITSRIIYIKSTLLRVFDHNIPAGFFHELGFSVEIIDLLNPENSFETYDRNEACSFIPDYLRAEALNLAKNGYIELIKQFMPRTIYRTVSFDGNVPAAMAKHTSLTDLLENLGYFVTGSGFSRDRWYWIMDRSGG
ncbi:MAG: hypothetical protein ACYC5H_04320 [Methylovirgula sp.]